MKASILITASALFVIATGCGTAEKKETAENTATATEQVSAPADDHHHDHASNQLGIELDNGAKWKVDTEMMKYIKLMESDVTAFKESNELQDYKTLGEGLQKNVDLLTSNCTMKGKAHDELHKWLLPYIEKVEQLNKSENVSAAQNTYKEIRESFAVLAQYFE